MIGFEHLLTSFGPGERLPAEDVWANPWWPVIALLIGIAIVLIGGILFSAWTLDQ